MTLSEWRIGLPSVHAPIFYMRILVPIFDPFWALFDPFFTHCLPFLVPFCMLDMRLQILTCACDCDAFVHPRIRMASPSGETLRNIEWKSQFEISQVSWSTWNTFESYLKRRWMDLHGPLNNVLLQANKYLWENVPMQWFALLWY